MMGDGGFLPQEHQHTDPPVINVELIDSVGWMECLTVGCTIVVALVTVVGFWIRHNHKMAGKPPRRSK